MPDDEAPSTSTPPKLRPPTPRRTKLPAHDITPILRAPRRMGLSFWLNAFTIRGQLDVLCVCPPILVGGIAFPLLLLGGEYATTEPLKVLALVLLGLFGTVPGVVPFLRRLPQVLFMRRADVALAELVKIEHRQSQQRVRVGRTAGADTAHQAAYVFRFKTGHRTVEAAYLAFGLASQVLDQEKEVVFFEPEDPTVFVPLDIFSGPVSITSDGRLVATSLLHAWILPGVMLLAVMASAALLVSGVRGALAQLG
jgi:hypothetical protein